MAPDAGKLDAVAAPKDAVSESNFNLGDAAVNLSNEAFELPGSTDQQTEALTAVNPMGAEQTGLQTLDNLSGAATDLVPDFSGESTGGKLAFDNSIYGEGEAAKNGDAQGEASNADGKQEMNMFGNAAFRNAAVIADMGKGPSEAAKQAADNFIFNGDNWFEDHNKQV